MRNRRIDFRYQPTSSWTLLCHPDDGHKTLVREDGALLYGFHADSFDSCHFERVYEFTAQTAHTATRVRQETESARRAIVRTTVEYPNQTLRLTAFSHDREVRCDVVLWEIEAHAEVMTALHIDAYLRGTTLAARAPGPCMELYPVSLEPRPTFGSWTDDVPRAPEATGSPALLSTPQTFIGVHATGFRPATGLMTTPAVLAEGEVMRGAIVLPVNGLAVELDLAWALQALEHERRFWDNLELQRHTLRVPDDEIQAMIEACARNLLQAREIEQGLPVLHVGPSFYRGLWLVDGYFMLEAARYLGLDDVAEAGLEVLLRRVKPTGAITQLDDVPHIKETAIAMATLVRQTQLSGDMTRLRAHWPVVLAAAAHINELRRQSYALPASHPLWGVMPEAFGDGGLADSRAEYTTVFWTLIGLCDAVEGARLLGKESDHAKLRKEYAELLEAFGGSVLKQRRSLGSGHYLPMGPGSGGHQFRAGVDEAEVPRWRLVQPETATWASCHAIWPGEVFARDAVWVRDLLELFERRDDEQGIPATTGWLPYRAVWTYAASFAAHVWLWAGRPDKAVDYLYAYVNHASPTRVWREEQSLRAGGHWQICGDMPHNWASAELIRLVRHLIVFESDGRLDLLAGVPEEWLSEGKTLTVESTPTRFGRVSLDVESQHDRLVAQMSLAPGTETARECRLRLPGRFRSKVCIDGADPVTPDADGWVRLTTAAEATMTVEAF